VHPRQRIQTAVFGSLVVHGAVALVLPRGDAPPNAPGSVAQSVSFEPVSLPAPRTQAAAAADQTRPLPGGLRSPSALDTDQARGLGGFGPAPEDGMLLFSFLSSLNLQDTDLNQTLASQTQRIHTSAARASQEERRATPKASDAAFLASGTEGHRERRSPAPVDAAWGAPHGATSKLEPSARAPEPGSVETTVEHMVEHMVEHIEQSARAGGVEVPAAALRGIDHGRGPSASDKARVAFARPNVDRGPAATPAQRQQEQVSDNRDAELLAARLERSLVDASLQRSRERGHDVGGSSHSGPGIDEAGTARGARARAFVPGQGTLGALDTSDGRYLHWFTHQRARVQDGLVFPHARALAKDQGVSLFRVEVRRDGSLDGPPRLLRSSGFSDFDAAAITAILRALPFEPLPASLAPEHSRLSLVLPVAFANPMVE
jgi:hypothetical protein